MIQETFFLIWKLANEPSSFTVEELARLEGLMKLRKLQKKGG